jgi:hypothetical protein
MNLPDAEAAAIRRVAREQGVDFMTAMSIFGERFDRLGRDLPQSASHLLPVLLTLCAIRPGKWTRIT